MLFKLPANQTETTYKRLVEEYLPDKLPVRSIKIKKYLSTNKIQPLFPKVKDWWRFLKNHGVLHGFYYNVDPPLCFVHPDTVAEFFSRRYRRMIKKHLKEFPLQ